MEEKKCEDCIYYVQHYVKSNLRYHSIFCGHCRKPGGHYRKTDKICGSFAAKNIEEEKKEQIQPVVKYLSRISRHIEELKDVFKDNE